MIVSIDSQTVLPLRAVTTSPASAPAGTDGESALGGLSRSFRAALASVERSEQHVDRAVRRLSRGADLSTGELLALQTEVYRSAQQAELVSRAVDRVSDTAREITQIRV